MPVAFPVSGKRQGEQKAGRWAEWQAVQIYRGLSERLDEAIGYTERTAEVVLVWALSGFL